MLNAKLKKTILESLPKGISLKRDNALWVKKSKKFRHNGEDKEKTLTHSVRLGITPDMSDAKAIEQFQKSVAEAIKIRTQMAEKLSSKFFLHQETVVKLHGVGTLKQVFDSLDTRGTWQGKHQQLVRQYFTDTLNFFLEIKDEKEPKLSDIHNIFTLGDFKTWCLKQVENRKMNMRGTVNTNSVNKRLGVWRQITAEAIRMKLWNLSDCIDPSRKCFGIEDFARNKSKPKKPLSIEEEDRLLNTIWKYNDSFWYDCIVVAIDTGVRHDGELNRISTDDIDFGKKLLIIKRPKTSTWSTIPLTARALEVFKRRREVALKDENNRFFPVSKSSIRHNWDKYRDLAKLDKNYTPYCTRHTFITRLVEAGVDAKTVMNLAGHGAIETTLTFYTHTTDDLLGEAISSLEKYRDKKKKALPTAVSSMIGHNSKRLK